MTTVVRALITKIEEFTPDCECKKYFKNPVFENTCSSCYEKNHPEKYREFIEMQTDKTPSQRFTQQELWDYTDELAIPYDSKYWTVLKHLFTTDSWQTDENLRKFIVHTKKTTKFKGIRAEQGGKLMELYLKSNHGGSFPGNRDKDKNDIMFYKVEHTIAGMIIDTWNIKSELHGGRAYCYYANEEKKPVKTDPNQRLEEIVGVPVAFKEIYSSTRNRAIIRTAVADWLNQTPHCATGGEEFLKSL